MGTSATAAGLEPGKPGKRLLLPTVCARAGRGTITRLVTNVGHVTPAVHSWKEGGRAKPRPAQISPLNCKSPAACPGPTWFRRGSGEYPDQRPHQGTDAHHDAYKAPRVVQELEGAGGAADQGRAPVQEHLPGVGWGVRGVRMGAWVLGVGGWLGVLTATKAWYWYERGCRVRRCGGGYGYGY